MKIHNIYLSLLILFVIGFMPTHSSLAQNKSKKKQTIAAIPLTPAKIISTRSIHFKSDPVMDQFIDDLMSKMTLDEKIGQLNLPSAGDFTTGQAKSSDIGQKIKDGKVGGLFNIKGVDKIREVQRVAVEESRMKIPMLFGMDVIHGYESTFPIPLGLASSWDMDLIEKSARVAAQEATADGINWTFSPWWIFPAIPAGVAFPKVRVKIRIWVAGLPAPWLQVIRVMIYRPIILCFRV